MFVAVGLLFAVAVSTAVAENSTEYGKLEASFTAFVILRTALLFLGN